MAKNDNLKDFLTDVANAIREKKGTTDLINPQDFSAEVREIAGLEAVEREPINALGGFLSDIADTIREAEGSTDSINPQDFAERILAITTEVESDKLPLYIEALETISMSFANTYQYSKDNKNWSDGTSSTTISASNGEKVYLRASGLTASSSAGIGTIAISGKCNVGGNVMSMLYGENYEGQTTISQSYAFYSLFKGQSGLCDASKLALPAQILSSYCYGRMFFGCTGIINTPAPPATDLAPYCYYQMFFNCASLINAPALPAMNLAEYCYSTMFYGCTSLINAPALPAMNLTSHCYYQMFNSCTNLVDAPILPAMNLAEYCYGSMFYGCTGIVSAPALPATDLTPGCYYQMFINCTNLVDAPILPAMNLAENCYGSMFYGCTGIVSAPALPATDLTSDCYYQMFNQCSNLQYIKAMFLTTPSKTYCRNWVSGVNENGTFVKNKNATWANTFGSSAIPSGWTVITE